MVKLVKEKRLRNCSAYVGNCNNEYCEGIYLRSYDTVVAYYGKAKAYIIDAQGNDVISHASNVLFLVSGSYDCSTTTMQHVRKFVQDYTDISCSNISFLRLLAKNPEVDTVYIVSEATAETVFYL